MSRTTRRSQFKETAYRNVESYVRHSPPRGWARGGYTFFMGPVDATWYLDYTSGRDGRCNEGGRRKRYRTETNELIRTATRRKEKALLSDPELYDGMTFETKLDGKFIAWDIW